MRRSRQELGGVGGEEPLEPGGRARMRARVVQVHAGWRSRPVLTAGAGCVASWSSPRGTSSPFGTSSSTWTKHVVNSIERCRRARRAHRAIRGVAGAQQPRRGVSQVICVRCLACWPSWATPALRATAPHLGRLFRQSTTAPRRCQRLSRSARSSRPTAPGRLANSRWVACFGVVASLATARVDTPSRVPRGSRNPMPMPGRPCGAEPTTGAGRAPCVSAAAPVWNDSSVACAPITCAAHVRLGEIRARRVRPALCSWGRSAGSGGRPPRRR